MALLETLADDFTTADSAKWQYGNGSIAVVGGQLGITVTSSYPTLLSTTTTYDATGSSAYLKVITLPNAGNGTTQGYWGFGTTIGTTEARFEHNNGTLYALTKAGGDNYLANATFTAAHTWQRIRESGGTTFWEVSSDGVSWNSFASVANAFTMTAVTAAIGAGYYGTEPTPGTFVVDNFNTADIGAPPPRYVADRGTAANATAGTTTSVTLTSPTSIAVGNYLVARVAVDNSGSSGAAPGCTVTDSRNTWTVLGPSLSDPGAASAGATAYLCYAKVATAYQAADTITFNWGGVSTTAKAVVVEEWSGIHRVSPVAVAAATNNSVAAASTTAVQVSITPTAPNQLVYTCLATEGIAADTVGADTDTTNGTWGTLTTVASANATATNNQRVSGQFKVVSAGGAQSWDSTITSRDWAAMAVVFAPLPFRAPDPTVRRLLPLLVR